MQQKEIKFRAWDLDNQIMHYSDNQSERFDTEGSWWTINEKGVFFEEMHFDNWSEPDYKKMHEHKPNQIVMQYTDLDLFDKNGKEICDGDLFKTENGYIGKVYIDRGNFKTVIKPQGEFNNDRIEDLDFSVDMGIEIIGNIYENPELLKGGD